ncbi:SDR family oxidoreductase [Streptomyces sp. N2-109]|uniref:SDR family oxidoreductase n=1 Tax=Streptomyces gossypii TaxID=2883101 RepID=A0ABT2JRL6_9ACTN|nr:SDR family oxidoreductase [Streptomyces gossypii]MCT2590533.1 SDR family oxidoreductase [Streptomyces gossypii]
MIVKSQPDKAGLRGKRFVVTGGSRGLGQEVVQLLLGEGAFVAACARRTDSLRGHAAETGQLLTGSLDVREAGRLEGFVEQAGEAFGGLDGVVACVGGAQGRGLEEAAPEDWSATWELNVGHSVRLAAAAAPHLRAAGGGSVVFIASVSGWKPGPQAQYGAAKAALIHLAASLARELGPDGIRVNAVSPGSMLIPGKRWDRMRREDPAAFAAFAEEFPGGALVAPREVAQVVAFLLSAHATGVSGTNIPVDRAQNAPTPDGY